MKAGRYVLNGKPGLFLVADDQRLFDWSVLDRASVPQPVRGGSNTTTLGRRLPPRRVALTGPSTNRNGHVWFDRAFSRASRTAKRLDSTAITSFAARARGIEKNPTPA